MERVFILEVERRRRRERFIYWLLWVLIIVMFMFLFWYSDERSSGIEEKVIYEVEGKFGIPFESKLNDGRY